MKIAIVSKSTAEGGGASRFAEDLATWLLLKGHEVDHLCATLPGTKTPFQGSLYPPGFSRRAALALHRRARKRDFNEVLPLAWLYRRGDLSQYDVVHFHDHFTAFSMLDAGFISRKARTFFTAHDFLHLTGDHIYPPLPGQPEIKYTLPKKISLAVNRWAAEKNPITYIYPSRWLYGEARNRFRFYKEPVLLPYGFDPSPYQFQTRAEARRKLGLPPGQHIICVSAHYLSDPRKGVQFALKAIASVKDLDPLVILIGNPMIGAEEMLADVKFWFAGYVTSRVRLGLLLAAADIYLNCTLQDNLPISVLEAKAAATPMAGFATGGVPDMISDGKSGWLVPTGDQEKLNQTLRQALEGNDKEKFGVAARENLATNFTPGKCVEVHEALYRGQT